MFVPTSPCSLQLAEKLEASEATVGSQRIELQQLRLVSGGGDLETIAALKAQIQVCTEDFETERQDRAKAQARAHLLQEEVNNLRVEVGSAIWNTCCVVCVATFRVP